jgi:hypothetical protein
LNLKAGSSVGKRLGRPPKKGTHIATNSLGSAIFSPEPDPDEGPSGKRFRPDEKTEGGEELHRLMMFGATLNPSSGMAREMTTVLQVGTKAVFLISGLCRLTTVNCFDMKKTGQDFIVIPKIIIFLRI